MLKQGDQGKEVRELQESLLKLGYELPKFCADGDFGSETFSAVTSFKQELVDLAEEEGVSTELQRLIDALVVADRNRHHAAYLSAIRRFVVGELSSKPQRRTEDWRYT